MAHYPLLETESMGIIYTYITKQPVVMHSTTAWTPCSKKTFHRVFPMPKRASRIILDNSVSNIVQ